MVVGLMSVQAHGFVPHHHHDDDAPVHSHAAEHHIGHSDGLAPSAEFDGEHPEVTPHDEASITATARHSIQVDLVLALPEATQFAFPSKSTSGVRAPIAYARPYGTGPPGTRSSRAPPASLTA